MLPEVEGDGAVARFADEVRALGALDHPNIVPIHDVGVTPEGKHFYVMKYIQGETLERVIEQLAAGDPSYHARYPFARRMEVFTAVLRAVQYAHAQGYVHRDLKPANIMVGAYGEVVVMDWGLARRLRDAPESLAAGPSPSVPPGSPRARTLDGSLLGTPAYMSPEQSRGELHLVDEVSDVYALGVICHELLTLQHYLHAHSSVTATLLAVDRVEPELATHLRSEVQPPVPAEYAHFIRHCMAKDRNRRFRSTTAALDRLEQIRNGTFPVECPVTAMKRMTLGVTHRIDRNPGLVMLSLMAAAGLALGGFVTVALILARRMG
ncbi:MAG: serine/threonine-protein kinase [Polyangiales bacterium]